jgi:hypothetical protein
MEQQRLVIDDEKLIESEAGRHRVARRNGHLFAVNSVGYLVDPGPGFFVRYWHLFLP